MGQPGRRGACIGQALDLTDPIERNYWFSGGVAWSDKLTVLESLSYASLPTFPSCNSADFAAADFAAVKQQLVAEFQAVGGTRLFGDYCTVNGRP